MSDPNGWISVEDEVPCSQGRYMVAVIDERVNTGWWNGVWLTAGTDLGHRIHPTHWQPLPAPPGESVEPTVEPTPERCSECRFWLPSETPEYAAPTAPLCRRHSPPTGGFPYSPSSSWCGEFERRGETKA